MEVLQVRVPKGIIKDIDKMVKTGKYANRSDAARSLLRTNLTIDSMIGIIPNTGDSVKEVREIRKKLSKEIKSYRDIEKINALMK